MPPTWIANHILASGNLRTCQDRVSLREWVGAYYINDKRVSDMKESQRRSKIRKPAVAPTYSDAVNAGLRSANVKTSSESMDGFLTFEARLHSQLREIRKHEPDDFGNISYYPDVHPDLHNVGVLGKEAYEEWAGDWERSMTNGWASIRAHVLNGSPPSVDAKRFFNCQHFSKETLVFLRPGLSVGKGTGTRKWTYLDYDRHTVDVIAVSQFATYMHCTGAGKLAKGQGGDVVSCWFRKSL